MTAEAIQVSWLEGPDIEPSLRGVVDIFTIQLGCMVSLLGLMGIEVERTCGRADALSTLAHSYKVSLNAYSLLTAILNLSG